MRRIINAILLCILCRFSANAQGLPATAPPASWVDVLQINSQFKAGADSLSEGVNFVLVENQINVQKDERYKRIVKEIINENGVQNEARLTFDFDPAFEHLIIHEIVVRRGTNAMNRLDIEKFKVIQQERDLERHIYNGALSAVIFLEDVRIGDQIDFSYTIQGANPIFDGKYVASFSMQWGIPIQRERIRVLWPRDRTLGIKSHGSSIQPVVRHSDNGTEYVWDRRDIPAAHQEDGEPSWYDACPWIQLSEFATWKDVAEWAVRLYPHPESLSQELIERIDGFLQSHPQPEARLASALQFLQDEIRYLGFELGPNSYRPNDPSLVFARRFGDCKDKAYLMCNILQRMDIEATPALVNTDYLDTIQNWLPSPYAFNHVVVRVEKGGKFLWFDPTRSPERGPIDQRFFPDYGRALLIHPGTVALTIIPSSTSGLPKTTVQEIFLVHEREKPARFTVRTVYEGTDADNQRGYFADTSREELEKNYLNYYAHRYPDIKTFQPVEIHDQPEKNIIEVTEQYEMRKFWVLSSDKKQYECEFYPQTIEDILGRPTTVLRTAPLRVKHPRHEILRTEVILPEPWPVTEKEVSVHNAAVDFTAKRTSQSNRLVMEYVYQSRTNCVIPTDVSDYIKSLNQIESALGYSLTWAKEGIPYAEPAKSGQINWSLLSAAAMYSLLLAIGWVWLYRRQNVTVVTPPISTDPQIGGIGGWLILVAIGLCISPFTIGFSMIQNAGSYSLSTWQTLTMPDGAAYHSWWAPALIFELFGNLTRLALGTLALAFLFQRRKIFPRLYIGLLLGNALFLIADHIGVQMIPAAAAESGSKAYTSLTRTVFWAFIWTLYMIRSKRVKNTFVC